jgi:hypothetical protein
MFQLRRWNKGVVERRGGDLEITVSPPRDIGDGVLLAAIAGFMLFGLYQIFFPPMFQFKSPLDLLLKTIPTLLFGIPFVLILGALFERQFADQIVLVAAGRITWMRKSRWWSRKRSVHTSEVIEISAVNGWSGLGRVDIKLKRKRFTVLDQLLNEDAVRFAHVLTHALKT